MTVMSSFTDGKANQTRCRNLSDRWLVSLLSIFSLCLTRSVSLALSHALSHSAALCGCHLIAMSVLFVCCLCVPVYAD